MSWVRQWGSDGLWEANITEGWVLSTHTLLPTGTLPAACRLPRFKGEPPPPTCMKPRSPKGPEEDSSSWFGSEITREQKQRNAEVCMWTGAYCISELGNNSLHSARSVRCWWVENETLNPWPAQPLQACACFQAEGCCTGGPVLLQKPGKACVEQQPAKAEPALPGCLSWFHFPWTLTHCCTVAPRYRISSKYFGREGSFPLGHIYMCHGISGQIASCLCQFPASAYIKQF